MTTTLNLSDITVDPRLQIRAKDNPHLVQEYAEARLRGDLFPPVEVYYDGEAHWLADGFTRVKSAGVAKLKSIEVNLHEGGYEEALTHALRANETHGLRRSNEDKRKAIVTALARPLWKDWSDRRIAEVIGVSDKTVGSLRKELANGGKKAAKAPKKPKPECGIPHSEAPASENPNPSSEMQQEPQGPLEESTNTPESPADRVRRLLKAVEEEPAPKTLAEKFEALAVEVDLLTSELPGDDTTRAGFTVLFKAVAFPYKKHFGQ